MSSSVHHFKAIGELKLELQSGNAQFGSKLVIFCPPWPQNLTNDLENNTAHLLSYFKLCASFDSHLSIKNGATVRKHQIWVKIGDFFVPCDLEIWRMTLKNNRAHLLGYFKLSASFHSHLWNQNEATVRKHQIWVKIGELMSRVTLKFDRWPRKTIGHLFYAISSFVHHLIDICEFKIELQSGNAKFGSKSAFHVPCDLEIWRMTLKKNRAPLLCYFKLCASFHSHPWIQTDVTVRKRLSYVLTSVTLTFDLWPWPFEWISLLSLVITPGNFMVIR